MQALQSLGSKSCSEHMEATTSAAVAGGADAGFPDLLIRDLRLISFAS
jgi:hypothetical protein